MKKLVYRSRAALIAALLAVALTPCFVFADATGAEPEPTAPADTEASDDYDYDYDDYDYDYDDYDYDYADYDYDPDRPWLYYEMTEEEYYEEFEPWRLTGQTEEEYWNEYRKNQEKERRESALTEFGFTDTNIINVSANGRPLNFEGAKLIVRNGVTMIPAREVFEALGADVSYDGKTKKTRVSANGASIVFAAGDSTVLAENNDGTEVGILLGADETPFIDSASASSYVPIRQLASSLGFRVFWNSDYKVVEIVDREGLVAEIDAQFTVINALIQSDIDKYAARLASDETERTDVNFTAELLARYDPDSYYGERANVTENGAKTEGKLKILSGGSGIDTVGSASLEINGFEEFLGELDQDPEIKAILDDLKKGVPFDILFDYADTALYLHLPILSRVDPRLDNSAWISFIPEDYVLFTESLAMTEQIIEDGEFTVGNLLYESVFNFDVWGLNRIDSLRIATRALAPFFGDAYMEKSGDVHTISMNRLELFNIFRQLSKNQEKYNIMGVDVYDYAEFTANIPVANYKLKITEKDGVPVSIELAVNVKVKTDDYYSDDDGYIEFHCALTSESETRKATADYSIAAENYGPLESGELSLHIDAVSAPTDETPRTKPPAKAKIISIDEL
jgi:hypothetical protein